MTAFHIIIPYYHSISSINQSINKSTLTISYYHLSTIYKLNKYVLGRPCFEDAEGQGAARGVATEAVKWGGPELKNRGFCIEIVSEQTNVCVFF